LGKMTGSDRKCDPQLQQPKSPLPHLVGVPLHRHLVEDGPGARRQLPDLKGAVDWGAAVWGRHHFLQSSCARCAGGAAKREAPAAAGQVVVLGGKSQHV
jgi:hypothetical protein